MPEALGPWRRWWRLSGAEKRMVLVLAWRMAWVDASLRLRGVKRTRRWLLRGIPPRAAVPVSPASVAAAQRIAALAAMVGRRELGQASCLRQALVVEQWLRRRGLAAELRVGVRRDPATGFDAHAWVELGGVALGQARLQHTPVADAAERIR